jgi:transcription antitermination factor NusG
MNDMDAAMNFSGPEEESIWWAVYTRHQHEKSVAQVLTSKGFEVFLPLYDSVRRWKDRNKILSLPLFPCYVFVRGGVTRRLQVVTTPGIHTILFHGDRVASIPSDEIDSIRKAVNSPSRVEPHPFLRCGETVRVTRGSLEGVRGVLIRKKSLYRLVLSVEMLAQSVAVEVDAADVEPVKQKDPGASSLLKAAGLEFTANQMDSRRGWSRRAVSYQRAGQSFA